MEDVKGTEESGASNDSPTQQHSQFGNGVGLSQVIDTKAPIESVKHAVSKFGGIVDWKAHKVQTVERRKFMDIELEKAREDIPLYKQNCAAAEEAKCQLLKELDITKTQIEELKLNLEKIQVEGQLAKQDSEQEKRRVEELEKGIASEVTFSRKAQLEVAKAKHAAALAELKTVQAGFEKLQNDFSLLATERDAEIKRAEEAVKASKEVEKTIEGLLVELSSTKGAIESVNAERLEGDGIRGGEAMAINQEISNLEKELKEAEEELERLNNEISSAHELRTKFDAASVLLQNLKGEFETYMETKTNQENDEDDLDSTENKTHHDIQAAIVTAKTKLEQVEAYKELWNTMEEVKQAKAGAESMESRLLSTQKEIDALKSFGELALTEPNNEESPEGVELSLEEYLELKKQVHEAEESETDNIRELEEMNREIVERKETLQLALQKAETAKQGKLKAEQELRNMREKQEQKREKTVLGSLQKIECKSEGASSIRQRSPRAAQAQAQAHANAVSKLQKSDKEDASLDAKKGKKKKKFLPKFFMFMGKKKSTSKNV